jgi:hypothetical protein
MRAANDEASAFLRNRLPGWAHGFSMERMFCRLVKAERNYMKFIMLLLFAITQTIHAEDAQHTVELGKNDKTSIRAVEKFIADYGISWTGAQKPMPAAAEIPHFTKGAALYTKIIAAKEVADAFVFSVTIDDENNIWVHQQGGIAGVDDWFGPIPIDPPAKSP